MKINSCSSNYNSQYVNNGSVKFGIAPKTLSDKLMKALEFDSLNFSTLGLSLVCYGAVFFPRYIKSRDPDEKREILVRDLSTITTIIFARRALLNIASELCSKATGFVLNSKPQNHKNTLQKIYNYLRPDNGIRTLSTKQIAERYSNIHFFKNGISDFADFITEQGGNIKKVLSADKKLGDVLKAAYVDWSNPISKRGNFDKATSTEIVCMLKDLNKKGIVKNQHIQRIEEYFKDSSNPILKKVQTINPIFDCLTTLLFVPLVLGLFLPLFNEKVTKQRHAKVSDVKNNHCSVKS